MGQRARHARGLGPRRLGLRPLRALLGADERRLSRPLRRRPAHGVVRRDAHGSALVLQAVRLLRPREVRARVPGDRPGDARERPAPQRPHARREGRLRPGLRAGAVHVARRLRDDAQRPGLLQRCAGLVPHLGRRAREPAAVRDRRPLPRPRARGHPPQRAARADLGRARQRLHARPLHGRGGRRALLHQHRPEERGQQLPEGDLGPGPHPALGGRADPPRALRVPGRRAARLGELDLLQPEARRALRGDTRARALRLDRKDEPRAGAQRHAERRGQRDAALRPRGGRAGAGGGRRGRRRAPARQARPARGRLRDGVRERDRALRRAERDRPAGPPQRRPQPPARRRAGRRLQPDAEVALSARTRP